MNLDGMDIGEADWSDSSYLSTIHYCAHRETKKKFVLKRSRNPIPIERIELMKKVFQFSHPNLLLPVEWWVSSNLFVEELYERVNWPKLGRFLDKLKKKGGGFTDSLRIMLQLTDVISLFHKEEIVHHDVRDNNIFIDKESLAIKVFDYNSITAPYSLAEGLDSWNPVPPEYRKGRCVIDFQFDVYQAGHLLKDLTHSLNWKSEKMEPKFDIPEKAIEIMNRALSENRGERYKNCLELHSELESLL